MQFIFLDLVQLHQLHIATKLLVVMVGSAGTGTLISNVTIEYN